MRPQLEPEGVRFACRGVYWDCEVYLFRCNPSRRSTRSVALLLTTSITKFLALHVLPRLRCLPTTTPALDVFQTPFAAPINKAFVSAPSFPIDMSPPRAKSDVKSFRRESLALGRLADPGKAANALYKLPLAEGL